MIVIFRWKAVSPPPPTFNCDFERGLCEGWRHLVSDEFEFEWDFNRGSTQTEKTGPSVDHTLGNSGKSSTNYGVPIYLTSLLHHKNATFDQGARF